MDLLLADLLYAARAALGRHPRDRAALQAMQARRLRRLVRHAHDAVPFYRRLYDQAGLRPEDIRGLADLARLPIVDKADLRASPHADTLARGYDPDRLFDRWTAGSTGEPFRIRKSWLDQQIQGAFRFRAMRDFGMRWGDRHVIVNYERTTLPAAGLQIGPFLARLGLYRQSRVDCMAPESEIMDELRRRRPAIVSSYPGVFARLGEWASRTGDAGARPRFVVTDSESLTPTVRRLTQTVFAAPVFDLYDCWETNLIAWQCQQHDLLHVSEDSVIVEVLRDGQPAAEGDSGEVVITPLFARAAPFIRYRLGDIATRGPTPCPCGRPYATLQSVVGRIADFFKLPDGRMIHPYAVTRGLTDRSWISRYQVAQRGPAALLVKVVPIGAPPAAALADAKAGLAAVAAEYAVAIDLALVDDIPPAPSGKHQPYIPLAASDAAAPARPGG